MKRVKKTPTERIESGSNPRLETAYIKIPGRLIEVSKGKSPHSVVYNLRKIQRVLQESGRTGYTSLHTHPTKKDFYRRYTPQSPPSDADLDHFLSMPQERSMIIAERNTKTGKVLGYTLIRKTKETPRGVFLEDLNEYVRHQFFEPPSLLQRTLRRLSGKVVSRDYDPDQDQFLTKRKGGWSSDAYKESLDTFCNKYHLQYKFIPVKDKNYSEKEARLEKRVAVFLGSIVAGIALSIYSLTTTGNAISNLTGTSQGLLGLILFVVGIAGLVFSKKKL